MRVGSSLGVQSASGAGPAPVWVRLVASGDEPEQGTKQQSIGEKSNKIAGCIITVQAFILECRVVELKKG